MPAFWIIFVLALVGLAVEASARFVAPYVFGLLSPGALRVLAGRPAYYPGAVAAPLAPAAERTAVASGWAEVRWMAVGHPGSATGHNRLGTGRFAAG